MAVAVMLMDKGNHWVPVTGDMTVHMMPVNFGNLHTCQIQLNKLA